MKVIWLSDMHLNANGDLVFGYDAAKRLELAVNYIKHNHADASYCVLSGDLADDGAAVSYRLIRGMTADLPMPILSIPGNHDDRDVMRQELWFPNAIDDTFLQYSIEQQNCRLIMLDTLHNGHAEGLLCESRLNWLTEQLSNNTTVPTFVFCHHHPALLNLPMQDKEKLINGDEFLDVLSKFGNVKHLFFGHVHRPVSGSFDKLGFTALQSTTLQAPLPYPEWTWDNFVPAKEAAGLGIIHLSASSVVVQYHAFCRAEDYYFEAKVVA